MNEEAVIFGRTDDNTDDSGRAPPPGTSKLDKTRKGAYRVREEKKVAAENRQGAVAPFGV